MGLVFVRFDISWGSRLGGEKSGGARERRGEECNAVEEGGAVDGGGRRNTTKTDVGGNRWREGGGRDLTMRLAYPSLGTSPKIPKKLFKVKK